MKSDELGLAYRQVPVELTLTIAAIVITTFRISLIH